MSETQTQALERAREGIQAIRSEAMCLQSNLSAIVQDLKEAGLNGEGIMLETGIRLISVEEAAGQAQSAV